jgi:hypothetical protein
MSQKVVLLDLENNPPSLKLLRDIVQHYSTLYLFNCTGKFEFALDDLTEFAGFISTGQIIILDIPETEHKEYEYAVLVGQLMALLEEGSHIELISAMDSSEMLMQMLEASHFHCGLIQVLPEESETTSSKAKFQLPSIETIQSKPDLQLVKRYCDVLVHLSGKPNTIESLKNSVCNILQLVPEKAQQIVAMLISLKIVKRDDTHVHVRKKVLKQWAQLDLQQAAPDKAVPVLDQFIANMMEKLPVENAVGHVSNTTQSAQQALFKDFAQIDPIQMEMVRKLRQLQADKPKDIYELRDLLEELFPKADVRLLLKELIEKGYIYWNGHEVLYSHEMFLN